MKISVRIRPGSRNEGVTKVNDAHFIVHVKAPPVEGRANKAIIKLLSGYFNIPKSHIQILKGLRSKDKVIEIKVDIISI